MSQLALKCIVAALLCGTAAAQARVTAAAAQRALQDGNQRFVSGAPLPQPLGEGARRSLARGQTPWAVVLTSADSRLVPEHIFNVGLGELFVVRIAGGICDPTALASVEYAAERLGAPLCVVLSHTGGGELTASAKDMEDSPGLARIATRLRPAVQRAASEGLEGPALESRAAEESAHETMAECLRRSAVLRELKRLEHFDILPATYDLASGQVTFLPPRPTAELLAQKQHRDGPPRPKTGGLPPHVALTMLQTGHRRFLAGTNGTADLSPARRAAVASQPRPFAVVLTDSDSRIAPEHLFDLGLGELAVVRVAGCALQEEVLGSIEYIVREHGTGLLVVLAPDHCGVTELLLKQGNGTQLSPSMRLVADWLDPSIMEAKHAGLKGQDLMRGVVQRNLQRAVREARLRSPMLRRLEARGQLGILGAMYRLADGEIEWQRDGRLEPAAGSEAGHDAAHPAPGAEPAAAAHGDAPHASAHTNDEVHGRASAAGHGGHDAHAADPHAEPGHGAHGAKPAKSSKPATHDDGHGSGHDAHTGHGAHAKHEAGHGDGHATPHGEHGASSHGDAHGHDADHASAGGRGPAHDSHAATTKKSKTPAKGSHGDHGDHGAHDDHGASPNKAPASGNLTPTLTIGLLVAIAGIFGAYALMQLGHKH